MLQTKLNKAISFDGHPINAVNLGVKLEGIIKERNFFLLPNEASRFAVFSDTTKSHHLVWELSIQSPFSNANKTNNKWYVNAKIAFIYFEFFWCPQKRICFARKGILKDGKSAIFYLKQPGFSKWRLWQDGKTKREMPCVL